MLITSFIKKKLHVELNEGITGDLENTDLRLFFAFAEAVSGRHAGMMHHGCSPRVIKHGWKLSLIYS